MADIPFLIMHIPERKKPCLFYKEKENSLVLIGQFKDEECKDLFIEKLNDWINSAIRDYWRADNDNV